MNLTSVDPPEVIRFVKKNYPDVELIKPRMSIYEMAKKKGCLPTRLVRWCCEEFKEMSGAGKVTLIGIRKSESTNRKKRKEMKLKRETVNSPEHLTSGASIRKKW
jgi:phosphoadenosine phosphosulfate reductase